MFFIIIILAYVVWVTVYNINKDISGKGIYAKPSPDIKEREKKSVSFAQVNVGNSIKCPGCNRLLNPNVAGDKCPFCGYALKPVVRFVDARYGTPYIGEGISSKWPSTQTEKRTSTQQWGTGSHLRGASLFYTCLSCGKEYLEFDYCPECKPIGNNMNVIDPDDVNNELWHNHWGNVIPAITSSNTISAKSDFENTQYARRVQNGCGEKNSPKISKSFINQQSRKYHNEELSDDFINRILADIDTITTQLSQHENSELYRERASKYSCLGLISFAHNDLEKAIKLSNNAEYTAHLYFYRGCIYSGALRGDCTIERKAMLLDMQAASQLGDRDAIQWCRDNWDAQSRYI